MGFVTDFPVASEWHPTLNGDLSPSGVTSGSSRMVWWLGKDCGHEWEAVVRYRTTRGAGCPVCSGKIVLPGVNDLATTHPLIAAELVGDVAAMSVAASSSRVGQWECSVCSYVYDARISSRTRSVRPSGCPACAGKVVVAGFNDLATTHPVLIGEWHPTKNDRSMSSVTRGFSGKVWWLGKDCGHEWEASPNNRTNGGTGCPVCAGRRVMSGVNDLATVRPEIAKQWHPTKNGDVTPRDVSGRSRMVAWWQCELDSRHEWKVAVNQRGDGGCPVCVGTLIIDGVNDRGTRQRGVVNRWWSDDENKVNPEDVQLDSTSVFVWQGICGHLLRTSMKRMNENPQGMMCHSCNPLMLSRPSIVSTHPLVAKEWDYDTNQGSFIIDEITHGSGKPVGWKCQRGHQWFARAFDRTVKTTSCPECSAKLFVSTGERELLTIVSALTTNNIESSVRSVIKGELDIYVPERNLAIEFNGVYWHSEAAGKTHNYHARKSEACAVKGIHLIHVWEDDWRDRRDIVVRALAHRLNATERLNKPGVLLAPDQSLTQRYGARTLTPEVITYGESAAFLETNHLQGKANGTLHTGLRDRHGTLRAVFVTKRIGNKGHEGEWRIERYATRGIVPGGFTKLMKFAETHIQTSSLGDLTKWVTFSDGALSDGGLYRNYGFVEDGFVKPDYQYVVNGKRVHKFNYRLKRFRDDPTLQYEEDLSERELALLNKIPRIWDSGKTRWVKRVT